MCAPMSELQHIGFGIVNSAGQHMASDSSTIQVGTLRWKWYLHIKWLTLKSEIAKPTCNQDIIHGAADFPRMRLVTLRECASSPSWSSVLETALIVRRHEWSATNVVGGGTSLGVLQWKDLWGISVWCVAQFFLKKSHCKIKLLNYIVCCLWLQTFRNFQQSVPLFDYNGDQQHSEKAAYFLKLWKGDISGSRHHKLMKDFEQATGGCFILVGNHKHSNYCASICSCVWTSKNKSIKSLVESDIVILWYFSTLG